MNDIEKAEGFEDTVIEMLQRILDNQEEFREEIIEKIDNISTPGVDFGYEGT